LQSNQYRKTFLSQMKLQQVSTLSFKKRDYDSIKKYLDAYIDSNTTYIMLDTVELKDATFKHKVTNETYYKDHRIQTITVKYKSQFAQ